VQLFAEGLNEVEARDLLMEAGSLYMEGAFASAKAGDLQGALAWANEGKARLLGVALRLRALETRADASRIQMLRREIRACSRALDAGDTVGRFAWRDPRLSNLRLADGKTLAVGDLAEATGLCPPRLVVLSACETGLYDTRRTPDEFIGWPATFMSLGATGVLSTLWLVDDRATTLLTAKFYDLHMAGGLAPAAALRQAQMWLKAASTTDLLAFIRSKVEEGALAADQLSHLEHMLQTSPMCARIRGIFGWLPVFAHPTPPDPASPSSPPFEHPFFWAGFVHTGL
jgi:CHAT domain